MKKFIKIYLGKNNEKIYLEKILKENYKESLLNYKKYYKCKKKKVIKT
jgi:hypothetical protein